MLGLKEKGESMPSGGGKGEADVTWPVKWEEGEGWGG